MSRRCLKHPGNIEQAIWILGASFSSHKVLRGSLWFLMTTNAWKSVGASISKSKGNVSCHKG